MIQVGDLAFREVWLVDFEFSAPPGERPTAVCLVAWALGSGRKLRIWEDALQGMEHPSYEVDRDALFVAYYASAEMGCHLALGWPLPVNVLDLFTEFRNATNGLSLPCGAGLLGALSQLRLSELAVGEDGRNRCLLSAFRARTGRNQPSNSRFIFGPAVWLRGLIQPPPGHGIAYLDWC